MLDGTDLSLLYEWQEYYELEPFGEERDDIRAANICLNFAEAMGMKKKGGGKLALKDFMLRFDKPAQKPQLAPIAAQSILKDRYANRSKP
jgi:hypothetical protein